MMRIGKGRIWQMQKAKVKRGDKQVAEATAKDSARPACGKVAKPKVEGGK